MLGTDLRPYIVIKKFAAADPTAPFDWFSSGSVQMDHVGMTQLLVFFAIVVALFLVTFGARK
jgi:hypothetical protein